MIGLGGIARSHAQGIAELDDVEIVACADLIESTRAQFMDTYDVPKGYASHTELLQDPEIDAVGVVLGHQLAPPAERGCAQRRQARTGREAHGAHAGAVRRDDRSRPRQRRKADGGSDQPLPARVHQSEGNPGLRAVGTPDHHRELHVQELELRQPPAAIPQPLSRRRYVAEQRRSRGGPGHLVHGLAGGVGVGVDWNAGALPGGRRFGHGLHSVQERPSRGGGVRGLRRRRTNPRHARHLRRWQPALFTQCVRPRPLDWAGRDVGRSGVRTLAPENAAGVGSLCRGHRPGIESPVPGEYGRHIQEILLAAETSEITRSEVMLASGERWSTQAAGEPVQIQHGWV